MTACSEDFHCGNDLMLLQPFSVLISMAKTLLRLRQLRRSLRRSQLRILSQMLLVCYSLHSHNISITVGKVVYFDTFDVAKKL